MAKGSTALHFWKEYLLFDISLKSPDLPCNVRFFVTPSDSVAIIAANAVDAIPYFSAGLKGVARFSIFLLSFLLVCFFAHVLAYSFLYPRIEISVFTDISVLRFYGYIGNIGGYFFTNIGGVKII